MNSSAYHDESDLICGLKNGDEEAFSSIFNEHWARLYNTAYSKTRDAQAAEEIVQELFATLWEKRESLFITNISFYLNGALRNRCIDYVRRSITREKYWQYCRSFFPKSSTDGELELHDLEEALERGMAGLSVKSQEVFKLNRLEGLSNAEISKRIMLSEKSVEYHLTKSLKHLRLQLREFFLSLAIAASIFF